MSLLINPGSGPVAETGEGWTNSYYGAVAQARDWLRKLRSDGIHDVNLLLPGKDLGDGRWQFSFHHLVSGHIVTLETHGVDEVDAYMQERIFPPRVYWNGSSSATPEIEDWQRPGYQIVKTLRATS